MAVDVGSSVKLIFLPIHRKDELRKIWHLEHLSIASSNDGLWIKGFGADDLLESRKLLDATCYDVKEGFLYLQGNKVPERSEAKGLLWSEIQKLIRLELPSFNENLFEVNGEIDIQMVSVSDEYDVAASIINLEELYRYVNQTSAYIFDSLKWCLLSDSQCFVVGKNIFTARSDRFWKYQSLLIPVGFDFSSELIRSICSSSFSKESDDYIVFDSSGSHFKLPKDKLSPLSRSSVKLTKAKFQVN